MQFAVEVINNTVVKYLPRKKIKKCVADILAGENITRAMVKIIFLDNREMRKLNKDYLGHDYDTDVLSFSLEEDFIDGEVYISIPKAKKQSEEYNVSLENELMRLSAHGTLHLAGYDDDTEETKKQMHNLENKYIRKYERTKNN